MSERSANDVVEEILIRDGDLVAQHVGRATAWTFIHIRRVADGMVVEHWACRDDMGLLDQVRG